jgi:hypothetical protein
MNSNYNTNCKKFCKVCFDAGKPEKEYASHFVKDTPGPNGKTICPTLLGTECRYCYELGHTSKFCPKLATKAKEEKQYKKQNLEKKENKKQEEKVKTFNRGNFAVLDDSDDEEEKTYKKEKEDFPSLSSFNVAKPCGMSFMNALQKTPFQVIKEQEKKEAEKGWESLTFQNKDKKVELGNNVRFTFVHEPTRRPQEKWCSSPTPEKWCPTPEKWCNTGNWNDDSDSDEEYEVQQDAW